MPRTPANPAAGALGFRVHSGWASAVAVGGDARSPVALDRRRIELADRSVAGSVQPFHAAQRLDLKKAERLIERCRESTDILAENGLRAMITDLGKKGVQVVGASIVLASGRTLGTLESTLASHALIHTAEGEFFRDAVRRAAGKCSVSVTGIKEREILEHGSGALGLAASEIQEHTVEMGRALGPPWRQDEKLAALAAWLVLASSR